LKWSNNNEESFNSWFACYSARIENNNDERWNNLKNFVKSEGFKFLEATEKKYKCASICRPGLFYLTQDIAMGPPEKDCLREMLMNIPASLTPPAYVSIVTGLIFFIGFGFSFPLCSGFSNENKI